MTDRIEFEMDLSGLKKELYQLGDRLSSVLPNAAMAGAMVIRNYVIEAIQHSPAGGHTYTRGNVTHQASAPGQPPATDTGFLVNSTIVKAGKSGQTYAEAYEGSTAEYDEALEFGTSRMAARPHHRPAIQNHRDEIQRAVVTVIKRAVE